MPANFDLTRSQRRIIPKSSKTVSTPKLYHRAAPMVRVASVLNAPLAIPIIPTIPPSDSIVTKAGLS